MANEYGVIFDGEKKAYVGSPHGKSIQLTPEVKRRIQSIAERHGVWYEGDGGDVGPNVGLFGPKSSYRGSWDHAFAKTVEGYPPEFLVGIFTNVEVNGQKTIFLDPAVSIFDSLIKHQGKFRYLKDRRYDAAALSKFLRLASDDKYDFLQMSEKRATKENLAQFLGAGERRMFPPNWEKYPYPAGKLMKKYEDARNQSLLDRPAGVYVAGAGHLVELQKMKPSLQMVGGRKADD